MSGAGESGPDAAGLGRRLRLIGGREIPFDQEGFFWDFDDWNEEVAQELAAESGLAEMGEPHWALLRFFREFYGFHGRAPLNRELKQGTGLSLLELQGLFPEGLKEGARRLSGLPNPKSCT